MYREFGYYKPRLDRFDFYDSSITMHFLSIMTDVLSDLTKGRFIFEEKSD